MNTARAVLMVAALIIGIMVMKPAPVIGVPLIGLAVWSAQEADTERLVGWIAVAGGACALLTAILVLVR